MNVTRMSHKYHLLKKMGNIELLKNTIKLQNLILNIIIDIIFNYSFAMIQYIKKR